jgi:hypothetical protein
MRKILKQRRRKEGMEGRKEEAENIGRERKEGRKRGWKASLRK